MFGVYDNSFEAARQEEIDGVPVLGMVIDAKRLDKQMVISSGSPAIREDLYDSLGDQICKDNLIHPSSIVAGSAKLGTSNHIFPMVFINAEAKLGNNNLINSKAMIEHESEIGDHCHIAIGAIVSGRVTIGNKCFIGAGSVIKDGLSICDNVTIGAGTVVINNIDEPGTYVGVPARKVK